MKFKISDLINERDLLSHVFLNIMASGIERIENLPRKKSGEFKDVEIELLINGESMDVREFFNSIWGRYQEMVGKRATEIVMEQTSEMFQNISNKLQEYNEVVEQWAKEINWSVDNPISRMRQLDSVWLNKLINDFENAQLKEELDQRSLGYLSALIEVSKKLK